MSEAATKACPFCAETIQAAAVLCRFCGRDLPSPRTPGAPGQTPAPSEPPAGVALLRRSETLDLLTSLVEKSLVLYEEDEQGRGRYRLLETVRQYSRDRLLETGEGEALRDRHLDWFLALAEEAEPELWRDAVWLDRLGSEHDNLRAALQWGAGSSPEAALRLAGALCWFWEIRNHLAQPRQQLEAALALRASAGSPARAKALCAAGRAAAIRGDTEQAMALGEEALALYRQVGDRCGMAWSLLVLWSAAWNRRDLSRQVALATEALSLFREVEDGPGTAMALHLLAYALEHQGYAERAVVLEEESLALCRKEGYRWFSAVPLNQLGSMALDAGQTERAKALQEEGLAIHQEFGNPAGIIYTLSHLAQGAQSMGDHARAAALYEEGLAFCRELGWERADLLLGMASVAHAQGEHAGARALLNEAQALGQGAYASMSEGHLLLELGDHAAARSRFEAGLAIRRQEENAQLIAWALLEVGHAAWLQGEHGIAQTHAVEALGLFLELNDKDGTLTALQCLAVVALARGQKMIAARLLGAVMGQRDLLGLQGTPEWRRPRERMGEAARAVSMEPMLAAAWAEGRAMPLEDAVALALDRTAGAAG